MLKIQYQSSLMRTVSKGLIGLSVLAVAIVGVLGSLSVVQAASSPVAYTEVPLTSTELTANWSADRTTPSGGFSSTSYEGRNDVLQMGVVGANRSIVDPFYYTEGLQRQLGTSPDAVKADLFVDSAWLDTGVRAGLWGVGHDSLGAVSAYPIVEFTTAGAEDFTGWRSWDGVNGGWTNLPSVPYSTDAWNTLSVVFNEATSKFDVYINGALAISSEADTSVEIGAVILNQFNYGPESIDYTVNWSKFAYGNVAASPTSKDNCKNAGWSAFGFRNQGLCIQYVNTGKDSRL
jgi:hypothetical protein